MKFNAIDALIANGYALVKDDLGRESLVKDYERIAHVAFYGDMVSTLRVVISLNSDKTVMSVAYSNGSRAPFKTKVHLNDKRAFNAIKATVTNNSFEF